MQRAGVAAKPAQMHFGPGQHTYIPQQGFQYPSMQPGGQPYMAMLPQQQGQNPAMSQSYPAMQRPGMPQSSLQASAQSKVCLGRLRTSKLG